MSSLVIVGMVTWLLSNLPPAQALCSSFSTSELQMNQWLLTHLVWSSDRPHPHVSSFNPLSPVRGVFALWVLKSLQSRNGGVEIWLPKLDGLSHSIIQGLSPPRSWKWFPSCPSTLSSDQTLLVYPLTVVGLWAPVASSSASILSLGAVLTPALFLLP